jgi:hypothetical protein
MYYYVIYEYDVCESEEYNTAVVRFDTANLACGFIEKKLKSKEGYELSDFEVIHGKPLDIQVETKQVVHLGV